MCGILIVVQKRGELDLAACRRALATLTWRGPDFSCVHVDGPLFMGQAVLSVTGQPRNTYYKAGPWTVAFNGEIYNFKALYSDASTDTEALARLHNDSEWCLIPHEIPAALDGMFAYASTNGEVLNLACDPQGEKTLYVYEDDDRIIAASEIRAIRSMIPLRLDEQALRNYFRSRHMLSFGQTVWRGVRHILPGHRMSLRLSDRAWVAIDQPWSQVSQWVDPAKIERNKSRSMDDLADELDALLDATAREMVPKKPWATVASGGVDSTLLSHYLARHGQPLAIVALHSMGKDRIVPEPNVTVFRVSARDYAAEMERCIAVAGEPLHSHSFASQSIVARNVAHMGARVLFGGEGADELFGGYETYLGPCARSRYSLSDYTRPLDPDVRFTADDEPMVFMEDMEFAWRGALEIAGGDAVQAMMLCDTIFQLPSVGLRGADLMTSMWGVEPRSVFVRPAVMEFALNLPTWAKVDPTAQEPLMRTKPLLKHLFLRYFPERMLVEKQGFAGFPNESGRYLGDPRDFLAVQRLGITNDVSRVSHATAWKLINVEWFLRSLQ